MYITFPSINGKTLPARRSTRPWPPVDASRTGGRPGSPSSPAQANNCSARSPEFGVCRTCSGRVLRLRATICSLPARHLAGKAQ
jgi:hypothetical protein